MEANVLSTMYRTEYVPSPDGRGGEIDFYIKEIRTSEQEDIPVEYKTDNPKETQRYVLRHELIHAFLFESGMDQNSATHEAWIVNEEMIDWMTTQMLKIMVVYESAINKNVIGSRYIDEIKPTEVEL